MCFRPADTSTGNTNKCMSCGKTIQTMGGSVLRECPFCGASCGREDKFCKDCGHPL